MKVVKIVQLLGAAFVFGCAGLYGCSSSSSPADPPPAGKGGSGGSAAGGASGAGGGAAGGSSGSAGDQSGTGGAGAGGDTGTGGGAGAGGAGGSGPDFLTVCTDLENALCEKLYSCDPLIITLQFGDLATCKSRSLAACMKSAPLDGTGGTTTDVEACATSLPQANCLDILAGVLPDACHGKGTKPDGAGCAENGQCAGDRCINKDANGCGTCATPGIEGGMCAKGVAGDCVSGLFCATATGVCTKSIDVGGDCSTEKAGCKPGLLCVNKACTALLAKDAACDPSAPACDVGQGLYCPFNAMMPKAMSTCQPLGVAKTGEACGVDKTTYKETVCAAGGICIPSSAMSLSGTCQAPVGDGMSCMPTGPLKQDPCTPPAKCLGGTCVLGNANSCK